MQQIKRIFVYIGRHAFSRPVYLFVYLKNYFNPNYTLNIAYYQTKDLVDVLKAGKSLIRLGDGELFIINGGSIHYQTYSRSLQKKLFSLIENYTADAPYILGLNKIPISKTNAQLKKDNLLTCWLPMKVYWHLYFNQKERYFDATAFYFNETIPKYFEEYFKTKQLILVTNLDNISALKSNKNIPFTNIEYIESPAIDAFASYETLKAQVLEKVEMYGRDKSLVLFACGPASKVLVFDLIQDGVVSIDVGRGIEVAYTHDRIDHIIYPGM